MSDHPDHPDPPAPALIPFADDPLGRPSRLFLPPKLVDRAVVALVAFAYLASVGVQAYRFHWQARTILAVAVFPAVFALLWRRRHPLPVLAVALAAAVVAFPFPMVLVVVALYTAALRLPLQRAIVVWLAAAACTIAGRAVSEGSLTFSNSFSGITNAGLVTALGLFIGARRAYLDRIRERALFARALAPFLPSQVAELVQASPSALSLHEELEVTILFSDIRGYSAIGEGLPPHELATIVGRHLAAMAEVVLSHGATLDKFAGDAVMAVFGAPRPMPDHAERAIQCAIAMQRRQAELNAGGWSVKLPRMDIGIGVNSGTVVAGTIGGGGRLHYAVIGDAVNVAQRLESEAKAGEILVSASSLALTARTSATPPEAIHVKGRQEPVSMHRIAWEGVPSDA
jgi:class 3 adenylate cyclase